MKRLIFRASQVLSIAVACSLCAAAWAGAATKYDTSYQNGGTLLLPQLSGEYGQLAATCSVSGDRLNIAGRFGFDSNHPNGSWSFRQPLAITSVKIHPRQPMSLGIAQVQWRTQRIPSHHEVLGESFDSDGGFAYVTRSPANGQRSKLKLFRVLATGSRDPHFGHNGYISITIPGFTDLRPAFRVIALPAGKVLVLAQTSDTQVLLRYTRTGRPDGTWGNSGVVELAAPKPVGAISGLPDSVDSATVTPEGGLLISANNAPGKTASGVRGLLKLTAAGNVATSWAGGGYWTPPAPSGSYAHGATVTWPGTTLLAANRKGGGYAVLYADIAGFDGPSQSFLRLAYVDKTSGVTTLFNDDVGVHQAGGDAGEPDVQPWTLGDSSSGPIFARAASQYLDADGTTLDAARFTTDTDRSAAAASFTAPDFAASALAVDPAAKYLYACGSLGKTSKNAKIESRRERRKAVAIRRVKL